MPANVSSNGLPGNREEGLFKLGTTDVNFRAAYSRKLRLPELTNET